METSEISAAAEPVTTGAVLASKYKKVKWSDVQSPYRPCNELMS